MAKVKVYNIEGKEIEEMAVSSSVFEVPMSDDLVHQALVSIQARGRQVLAHTKTRGERAGSGIKPWRQKGTGRARVGSVRTPVWRKGGVVFGPLKDKNFFKKINKKMNSKAITMVLSEKLKGGELKVVDSLAMAEKKTKLMAKALKDLNISGKTLMSFSNKEKDLRIVSRNIEKAANILTDQLNVEDMLSNKYLLMSKESVKFLENKYGKK